MNRGRDGAQAGGDHHAGHAARRGRAVQVRIASARKGARRGGRRRERKARESKARTESKAQSQGEADTEGTVDSEGPVRAAHTSPAVEPRLSPRARLAGKRGGCRECLQGKQGLHRMRGLTQGQGCVEPRARAEGAPATGPAPPRRPGHGAYGEYPRCRPSAPCLPAQTLLWRAVPSFSLLVCANLALGAGPAASGSRPSDPSRIPDTRSA